MSRTIKTKTAPLHARVRLRCPLDLPTETLEEVLAYLPPLEVVKFQQVLVYHGVMLLFFV